MKNKLYAVESDFRMSDYEDWTPYAYFISNKQAQLFADYLINRTDIEYDKDAKFFFPKTQYRVNGPISLHMNAESAIAELEEEFGPPTPPKPRRYKEVQATIRVELDDDDEETTE